MKIELSVTLEVVPVDWVPRGSAVHYDIVIPMVREHVADAIINSGASEFGAESNLFTNVWVLS